MTCPSCGDRDCPADLAHAPPRTRAELEAALHARGVTLYAVPAGWCLHAPGSPLLNRDGLLALAEMCRLLVSEATTPGRSATGSGGEG